MTKLIIRIIHKIRSAWTTPQILIKKTLYIKIDLIIIIKKLS